MHRPMPKTLDLSGLRKGSRCSHRIASLIGCDAEVMGDI
jgi:hypothetical protein